MILYADVFLVKKINGVYNKKDIRDFRRQKGMV